MDPAEWRRAIGARIEHQRGRESIRTAAKRAGIDEALWRQVERGYRKQSGMLIPANPRDASLEAISLAVGLDPAEVFAAVGRSYVPNHRVPPEADRVTSLEKRMDRLETAVARIEEALP